MPRDAGAYLEDVVSACDRIQRLTRGKSIAEYRSDEVLRWAVERQFTILGEAVYQVRTHFPALADQIPESRRIINFRHVLIHGYATVEHDVVWGLVESNVQDL